MRKLACVLLIMSLFVFAGCGVQPSKVSDSQARKMAEKMTFFKEKTSGLCFGVIATRRGGLFSRQSGMGMTAVDCEDVKDLLVNKPKED